MKAAALSHKGLVRPRNEDAYLLRLDLGVFAVADGLGGHRSGEVASHLALRVLEERLCRGTLQEPPLQQLKEAVASANEAVYQVSLSQPEHRGMATTLTAAWMIEDRCYLAHVGDSRAYIFRQGILETLTTDHSYVGDLIQKGDITREEARFHPLRNLLNRALGIEGAVEVDTREIPLTPGDVLLLCTDGLYEVVSEGEMKTILSAHSLDEAARLLVENALDKGGPDNITVVLVLYEEKD